MNASCNPSIASEMNARHKRPHRLALLATSPVATGEAKIPSFQPPLRERGRGTAKRWWGRKGIATCGDLL